MYVMLSYIGTRLLLVSNC